MIVDDSSDFETELEVKGVTRHGYRILEVHGPVVPNTIASVLLHIRDTHGLMPHIYFRWTEGNPVTNLLRFLAFGKGRSHPSPPKCSAKPNPMCNQTALGPRRLNAAARRGAQCAQGPLCPESIPAQPFFPRRPLLPDPCHFPRVKATSSRPPGVKNSSGTDIFGSEEELTGCSPQGRTEKGTCNGRCGCDRNSHGVHGIPNVDRPPAGRDGRRRRGPAGGGQ